MEISEDLKNFINENLDLINKNTKESWEEIYSKLYASNTLEGNFTDTLLSVDIDPASILGYIPANYLYSSGIHTYRIPDNVTSIGEYAFAHCKSLTNIVIPNSVTSIDERAFWCCRSLTSVVIPDSVTEIGD